MLATNGFLHIATCQSTSNGKKRSLKTQKKKSEEAKTKQGYEENEIVPSLNHNGEEYEKAHTHIHIKLNHFAIQQK